MTAVPRSTARPRRRERSASRWPRRCAGSGGERRPRRGRRARCCRGSRRRWARRSARRCVATASSSRSASRRPRARRDGADYVLELDDGRELRGDRLLVATGRRPRVARHRPGDGRHRGRTSTASRSTRSLRAGERLWAIGDVNGIWLLTHVGKYQGDVVAANILGEPRPANYEAVPRVVFTDPQAAAVGAVDARVQRAPPRCRRSRRRRPTRAPTPRATASSPCSATASG